MTQLTEGQQKCMEAYKSKARSLIRQVETSDNTLSDRIDNPMRIEEALANLGKYHFFARKLGIPLDKEYLGLLEKQIAYSAKFRAAA
jgi:hypothetical protein